MGDEYRTVHGQGNWTWEMSSEQYRDEELDMGDEYGTVQGRGNWTWEMSTE